MGEKLDLDRERKSRKAEFGKRQIDPAIATGISIIWLSSYARAITMQSNVSSLKSNPSVFKKS